MNVKSAAEIEAFLTPVAEQTGVEILDVRWDMREKSLNIVIDAEGGVDLNLCEKFHRAIDAPLDGFDPSYGASYTLNCSSPGLDRPFRTERDFRRHMGERVEVHLYAPIDGKKYYEGELSAFDGENVTIRTDGGEKTFPFKKTSKVCLFIDI